MQPRCKITNINLILSVKRNFISNVDFNILTTTYSKSEFIHLVCHEMNHVDFSRHNLWIIQEIYCPFDLNNLKIYL